MFTPQTLIRFSHLILVTDSERVKAIKFGLPRICSGVLFSWHFMHKTLFVALQSHILLKRVYNSLVLTVAFILAYTHVSYILVSLFIVHSPCSIWFKLHQTWIPGHGLTLRRLMSYIYGAPILDVSRSHTTTQHSR